MAGREVGVRALRAAVCGLDGPEELLLERVGAALVELLVRIAERAERDAELVRRLGHAVEQLLPRFRGDVRHAHQARAPAAPRASLEPRCCFTQANARPSIAEIGARLRMTASGGGLP